MSVERLSDRAIEIIDDLHTERLDYTSEYLPLIDAANKLDAYEDTGLEPEEIEQLKGEVFGLKVDKQELEQYRAIGPIDRLRELVEADRDGRCVVLPCKVGDKVYVIDDGDYHSGYKPYAREKEVTEISWKKVRNGKDLGFGLILKGGDCGTSARYKISSVGKTVFLTREAAEAALKGE